MKAWSKERSALVVLLAVYMAVLVALCGAILGWWTGDSSSDPQVARASEPSLAAGVGIDGPTVTPRGSLVFITNTPTPTTSPSSTATPLPPTSTARPTRTPEPTSTPRPEHGAHREASADHGTERIDFSGRWRVTDTVTRGRNTGRHYSFDITLTQDGDRITGGNSDIRLFGTVRGDTAIVAYTQPALGYNGTFVWKMSKPDQAEGRFTSTFPNSGDSVLERLG